MSRLCRLKTKLHGEDGLWAYNAITQLRAKVAELQSSHDALEAKLEKYQNLEPVAWVGEIAEGVELYLNRNDFVGRCIPLYALEMK